MRNLSCLCVVGCSVNGICPLHGDQAARNRKAAALAYATFLDASREALPIGVRTFSELSPIVRDAWICAAAAVLTAVQCREI